jgi:membrane-associated HD superfamily phosphohydrolase
MSSRQIIRGIQIFIVIINTVIVIRGRLINTNTLTELAMLGRINSGINILMILIISVSIVFYIERFIPKK